LCLRSIIEPGDSVFKRDHRTGYRIAVFIVAVFGVASIVSFLLLYAGSGIYSDNTCSVYVKVATAIH
jgi:hypothetical protein